MSVCIERMTMIDVWLPAANERKLLDAFARKRAKTLLLSPQKHPTIEALCKEGSAYGISVGRKGDRIVLGEECDRENLGNLWEVFTLMAPFMGGGTVEMRAEGDDWKWVFRGGELLSFEGTIVYEDELSPAWLGAREVT
jgi:hypothetical protein